MVGMTVNDLYTKVKVIHFGANRFLIYDYLQAVDSTNFCSRMHHLATIHSVQTDNRQTDTSLSHKRDRTKYSWVKMELQCDRLHYW